jgi:hypothetical protein
MLREQFKIKDYIIFITDFFISKITEMTLRLPIRSCPNEVNSRTEVES